MVSSTRIVFAILLFLIAPGCRQSKPPSAAPAPKYRLVVALSIDMMRYDYLTRFSDLYRGGLHRLLKDGAVYSNALYHHAYCETGPGHSVLLTGCHPSRSGIVGNDWYDPVSGKRMNVVDDARHKPLGGGGRGASPANLLCDTIGDFLKKRDPSCKVIGISGKDRTAVLMAGHRADGAFWFDRSTGNFVTSTYYTKELPEWLDAWNGTQFAGRYSGENWNRFIDDPALYERYAGEDAVEGEADRMHTTFPHPMGTLEPDPSRFYERIRNSPFIDEMTLSVTQEAIRTYRPGSGQTTDLLAIGFSGTDLVTHVYGPDSQEVMDQLLRLDRLLNLLFQEIDKQVGLSNTLVALSADHGALPLVELLQKQGLPAQRVHPEVLEKAVQQALAVRYPGVSGLISLYEFPSFYLNLDTISKAHLDRSDVEKTVIAALYSTGLIEHAYTHSDLAGKPPAGDPDFPLFRNNFHPDRAPHIFVGLKPYIYMERYPGGTGHGTHHDYDRHVPIILMGKGIRAGTYSLECGPHDLAPALARLLDLPLVAEADSMNLLEAWK